MINPYIYPGLPKFDNPKHPLLVRIEQEIADSGGYELFKCEALLENMINKFSPKAILLKSLIRYYRVNKKRKVNLWSEADAYYLINNYGKLTSRKIAERLGRSQTAIIFKAFKLGIKKC
jgi:hypothetical protein